MLLEGAFKRISPVDSMFPAISTSPLEFTTNLFALLVVSSRIKEFEFTRNLKSGLSLASVKFKVGVLPPIVIPLTSKAPVVTIFCDPKSGEIFDPAIAASEATFAFVIAPSSIAPAPPPI